MGFVTAAVAAWEHGELQVHASRADQEANQPPDPRAPLAQPRSEQVFGPAANKSDLIRALEEQQEEHRRRRQSEAPYAERYPDEHAAGRDPLELEEGEEQRRRHRCDATAFMRDPDELERGADPPEDQKQGERRQQSQFDAVSFMRDPAALEHGADPLEDEIVSSSPLNSSLDLSDKEQPLYADDDYQPDGSIVLPTAGHVDECVRRSDRECVTRVSVDVDQDRSSDIFALSHGPGVLPGRMQTAYLPICAVVGAETLLGSHVVQRLLAGRTHCVRALVRSAAAAGFLRVACMEHDSDHLLTIVEVGQLTSSSSQIPLRGALRGVRCVVNCTDVTCQDTRTGRVADRAVAAARALADAAGAPGSSVLRFIHSGSDLSVWDPRSSQRDGIAIEPELDENCWFGIDDPDRKNSHAEGTLDAVPADQRRAGPPVGSTLTLPPHALVPIPAPQQRMGRLLQRCCSGPGRQAIASRTPCAP
jgi:hypothetical protein